MNLPLGSVLPEDALIVMKEEVQEVTDYVEKQRAAFRFCENFRNTVQACQKRIRIAYVGEIKELKTSYILVFHVFKEPQFSVRALGVDDGLERPGQLLDGDLQACLCI